MVIDELDIVSSQLERQNFLPLCGQTFQEASQLPVSNRPCTPKSRSVLPLSKSRSQGILFSVRDEVNSEDHLDLEFTTTREMPIVPSFLDLDRPMKKYLSTAENLNNPNRAQHERPKQHNHPIESGSAEGNYHKGLRNSFPNEIQPAASSHEIPRVAIPASNRQQCRRHISCRLEIPETPSISCHFKTPERSPSLLLLRRHTEYQSRPSRVVNDAKAKSNKDLAVEGEDYDALALQAVYNAWREDNIPPSSFQPEQSSTIDTPVITSSMNVTPSKNSPAPVPRRLKRLRVAAMKYRKIHKKKQDIYKCSEPDIVSHNTSRTQD